MAYSGSVIQWLRDNLQVIASAKDSEQLAQSVPDNGGRVCFFAYANNTFIKLTTVTLLLLPLLIRW